MAALRSNWSDMSLGDTAKHEKANFSEQDSRGQLVVMRLSS
jgi:hypothetical protein